MTKCRECNKEVSRFAEKCPHCGEENPGLTQNEHGFQALIWLIFIVVLGYWWFIADEFWLL
jgi:RNA polymerase subunit RPABC4/transcription elongation factor Spt4